MAAKGALWPTEEVQCLLEIWADESIKEQLDKTHKNSEIFGQICGYLRARGYHRTIEQCRNKLKKLRCQYLKVREAHGQPDSSAEKDKFQWYDAVDRIIGLKPCGEPHVVESHSVTSSSSSSSSSSVSVKEETGPESPLSSLKPSGEPNVVESHSGTPSDNVKEETGPESPPSKSPVSPQTPPNKSAKKVSRGEQMVKDMKDFFMEIDRDFEERERLRLLEQRQYEECLRKESKEEEREEQARQMAMFKELLESQNNLLRELLRRIPSPTSQQVTPSKNSGILETTSSVANIPETRECTKSVPSSHAESCQSPPNKRAKKVSQEEQIAKDMKGCFAEIARTLEERERLRLLEQRQHEERLKKEAKEDAREERARQMTMFKEMQEAQNDLLKELLRRMPSPTLQQFNSFKYWHSGNQSKFNTDTAGNSNVQNTSEQDMIFNPPSSTYFME